MRSFFFVLALVFFVMWFACWAATVVPGSSAVTMQWAAGNALAFLVGIAFGAAARCGKTPQPELNLRD